MADVYCPKCGSPLDVSEFQFIADDFDITPGEAQRRFFNEGCSGVGYTCDDDSDPELAEIADIMHEIYGDDVDAIASDMNDYRTIRGY